jgi:hypothetical protein
MKTESTLGSKPVSQSDNSIFLVKVIESLTKTLTPELLPNFWEEISFHQMELELETYKNSMEKA